MANPITVTAPPNTMDVTQETLAMMAALSGVVTDYNIGSQVRTMAESIGSVIEQQGIAGLTLALQTIAYSAMSLFSITPNAALPATGTETFTTALINPPPATQAVSIPAGTVMQTVGGIQFTTVSGVTLLSGATSVTAPIQAVQGGIAGNVAPGTINQLLSGLTYPLAVTNVSGTAGGVNAETPAQAQTRLAAVIASLVGGSPVSVANAAIGVTASGTNETVIYSSCFEPWLYAGSGPGSGNAGFTVYIDNGSGAATSGLIAAVTNKLNGSLTPPTVPGYRPSGVPYGVSGVVPVYANVAVSGSIISSANVAQVSGAITSAVSGYFTLPFGTPAYQASLAAVAANAALGALTSLNVSLYFNSNPSVAVSAVTGAPYTRIVLNTLSVNI